MHQIKCKRKGYSPCQSINGLHSANIASELLLLIQGK